MGDESGYQKKPSERGTRTNCRVKEGQVRTPKETEQAGDTDFLFGTEGGQFRTPKEKEQAGDTDFLFDTEGGQFRTLNKTERTRGTHSLTRAEGGGDRSRRRKEPSEGHSPSVMVGHKGRDRRQVVKPKDIKQVRGTHVLSIK
jgi:hypothetical protein